MVKIDFNKKGIKLYNADCFDVFKNIKKDSIDLFILDLPFGKFGGTACKWDTCIDLEQMWINVKRIMKPEAILCFFCTTKFGYQLIKSNEKWFKYDLIYAKSRRVGFLSAARRQLRAHENIYVFSDNHISYCKNGKYGVYNPQKIEAEPYQSKGGKSKNVNNSLSRGHEVISKPIDNKGDRHPTSIIEHENIYVFNGNTDDNQELINYSKKILKYIGKTKAQIKKDCKDADHFFRYSKGNFSLPTKETYNKLIELYKIDNLEGFIKYDDLKNNTTYNPQKLEGKPYKTRENDLTSSYYRDNKSEYKSKANDNKGDRHPTSVIEHENIYVFKDKQGTYNAQKTQGHKPYINNNCNPTSGYYREKGEEYTPTPRINKGDRHPTSIIEHENVYIFKDKQGTYNPQKTQGHKPYTENRTINLKGSYYRNKNNDYNMKLENYNNGDRHPTSVIEHENIYVFKDKQGTYNPQKTEGKPYKTVNKGVGYFREKKGDYSQTLTENKGDRYPTSVIQHETTILKYKSPHKTIHRTEKPVGLLEYLIKTYSNEGDVVMDFTMGSGSCGVACYNTKRKFIGVEMDKDIYKLTKNRIVEHLKK